MNYKTDDDFDFYSELNNMLVDDPSEGKKCMISHLPLTYNAVVLPCTHVFNYMAIYNELCANLSNDYKLHCPYCRAISDKLLPYIPLPNVGKTIGVNHPAKSCMPSLKCGIVLKHGTICDHVGLETAEGILCLKHLTNENNEDWNTEKAKLFKEKNVVELRGMLRAKGLKVGGVKKELVNRLIDAL